MADNKKKFVWILLVLDTLDEKKKKERKRNVWTRAWLKRREERGVYHLLMRELELEDAAAFTKYFRMPKLKFDELVDRIGPK